MSRTRALFTMLTAAGLYGWAANADSVNPSSRDDGSDCTYQTWEFYTDDIHLVADQGYVNPFGDPTMTDVYLANPQYMMWVWESMGGGTRNGLWGGMTFGVEPDELHIAMTYAVPNSARSEPWFKELWIQFVANHVRNGSPWACFATGNAAPGVRGPFSPRERLRILARASSRSQVQMIRAGGA